MRSLTPGPTGTLPRVDDEDLNPRGPESFSAIRWRQMSGARTHNQIGGGEMSAPCSIQMFAEPITSSLEDIDGAELDVFYALVIINPFGPTLTFVASDGKSTLNATLP